MSGRKRSGRGGAQPGQPVKLFIEVLRIRPTYLGADFFNRHLACV